MSISVDWPTALAVLGVGSILLGIAYLVLRARLAADFPTRREHGDLADRVERAERNIAALPTAKDMSDLTGKIADLSRDIAVANARLDGVGRAMTRIEDHLDQMMRSQLEREAKS